MKNKFILSFCLIIILTISSFSQTNYKAGYIVKDKDTIYGEIDYRNDVKLSKICRFKKGDEIKEYTPTEIDQYRFEGDRLFISKEIDEKKVFLEILIKGKLNVFTFSEIVGEPRYFISNDEYSIKEITYPEEEIARDAKNYKARLNKHKAVLNIFTSDAPSMQSTISAIQEPRRKNLMKLAKTYHYKVCDTEDCIVYESKQRKVKILAELRFGVKSYFSGVKKEFNLTRKSFFKKEALVYFSIPKLGDEWFFKTGLSISKLEYYHSLRFGNKDISVIQIPLQLQYIKNKGIVRPKLSLGLGYLNLSDDFSEQTGFIINILTEVGLNIKIFKKTFVSLNSEFESGPINSIYRAPSGEYKLYSINLTAGLVYQF